MLIPQETTVIQKRLELLGSKVLCIDCQKIRSEQLKEYFNKVEECDNAAKLRNLLQNLNIGKWILKEVRLNYLCCKLRVEC